MISLDTRTAVICAKQAIERDIRATAVRITRSVVGSDQASRLQTVLKKGHGVALNYWLVGYQTGAVLRGDAKEASELGASLANNRDPQLDLLVQALNYLGNFLQESKR